MKEAGSDSEREETVFISSLLSARGSWLEARRGKAIQKYTKGLLGPTGLLRENSRAEQSRRIIAVICRATVGVCSQRVLLWATAAESN